MAVQMEITQMPPKSARMSFDWCLVFDVDSVSVDMFFYSSVWVCSLDLMSIYIYAHTS